MPVILDGSSHIFDRASPDLQAQDFNSWRDKRFADIVADCGANHGAVFVAYLEKMVTSDFDIEAAVQEATAAFLKRVGDIGDDVVARDVAGKFGLVYAGGLLGIRLGILPWEQEALIDAISKCYLSARNLLPDEGVALRQGMAILRSRLDGLDLRKKLKANASTDWDKVDGYRWRSSGLARHVIKRDVFHTLFATTFQKELVLKYLIENNQITTAVGKGGDAAATAKTKKQFTWPTVSAAGRIRSLSRATNQLG